MLIFLLFLALQLVPTEQRDQITVLKISPNSSFLALGQPLKLNVTFNVTGEKFHFNWSFRRFFSTPFNRLAVATVVFIFYKYSYDSRASIVDKGTLLLVNTTLYDSGTYRCRIWLPFSGRHSLYFNVTIEDEPKAEISCFQSTTLTEGESFSCWCQAVGVNMVPTASWVKNGHILGNTSSHGAELSLRNVKKDVAGTYVCRAQLYSLTDEKITEIIVYYRPRISSFESRTFKNNSLKLSCVADGEPQPSYTFLISNGTAIAEINNGVVIMSNYSSSLNESYTCIAENTLGRDKRRLFVDHDLRFPAKKQQKANKKGIEWYIPLVAAIVGILLGVGLVYGFRWIRRKNVMPNQPTTQRTAASTIYSEPITPVTSRQGVQVSSKAIASTGDSSSDYQELNTVRENEENTYQSLRLTTRMKQVAYTTRQR